MKTKIDAAKICQLSGCYMAIANGNYMNPIKKIIENQKSYKEKKTDPNCFFWSYCHRLRIPWN